MLQLWIEENEERQSSIDGIFPDAPGIKGLKLSPANDWKKNPFHFDWQD